MSVLNDLLVKKIKCMNCDREFYVPQRIYERYVNQQLSLGCPYAQHRAWTLKNELKGLANRVKKVEKSLEQLEKEFIIDTPDTTYSNSYTKESGE